MKYVLSVYDSIFGKGERAKERLSKTYGEIPTSLFMRFKSRDPVICILIRWSRDYDPNAINRFYTKNKNI